MTLCGIDEAGRGCIAGDMVIAGVILDKPVLGLCDSKKLTRNKRQELFKKIIESSQYHIVRVSPKSIDNEGLSLGLQNSIKEIMQVLSCDDYLFDGNTTFGIPHLRSQIKADRDIQEVSAASILAKVTKDNLLIEEGKKYPNFSFASHQGYGTKKHIEEIRKYGYTPLHRKSYKIKALEISLY
jgi:ribonuclease HII